MLSPDTTFGSFVTIYVASSASSSVALVKTKEITHVKHIGWRKGSVKEVIIAVVIVFVVIIRQPCKIKFATVFTEEELEISER